LLIKLSIHRVGTTARMQEVEQRIPSYLSACSFFNYFLIIIVITII